jgi:hypothetical protein
MNKRLDYLLRKNKGDKMLSAYKDVFLKSGFPEEDIKHISLEDTDKVMEMLHKTANYTEIEYEIVAGDCRRIECSKLLSNTLNNSGGDSCYVYMNDYEYCGMFLCSVSMALTNVLKIAYNNKEIVFFILSTDYTYSLVVYYGDMSNSNFPNMFDVQYRTRLL